MPIMMPNISGGAIWTNLTGRAPSTTGFPQALTAAGATNTKSAWTAIDSTTPGTTDIAPYNIFGITVVMFGGSQNAGQCNVLLDIGVGASGSEVAIASNLPIQGGNAFITVGFNVFFLPIFIPKGTRVSARYQMSAATVVPSLMFFGHGGYNMMPWRTFSGCEGIGINTTTSSATFITPGASGAFSAWTNVGAATTREYKAIFPVMQTSNDTNSLDRAYHFEWGINSTALGERFHTGGASEAVGCLVPNIPDYITIPSGTQLQVRATCSGTVDQLAYGFIGFY